MGGTDRASVACQCAGGSAGSGPLVLPACLENKLRDTCTCRLQCILCRLLELACIRRGKRKTGVFPTKRLDTSKWPSPGSGDSTGLNVSNGQRGSRIEELGSGMTDGKLRHANRFSYWFWFSRVSVTRYPPTGPNPAAKLPVGASSPLLHGMIRPQQRRSLRPIYFIYPHEGDPSYFPSRWALSTLPSGPAVFLCYLSFRLSDHSPLLLCCF